MTNMLKTVEIFLEKVAYPRCNDGGDGSIYKAELSPLHKIIYICNECDALWKRPDQITNHLFMGLGEYIRLYGYTYNTINVTDINYHWYTNDTSCP